MKKPTALQVRQALNSQEAEAVVVLTGTGEKRRIARPVSGWSESRSGQFSAETTGPVTFSFLPKQVLEIIRKPHPIFGESDKPFDSASWARLVD